MGDKLLVILRSPGARARLTSEIDAIDGARLQVFDVVEGPGANIALEGRGLPDAIGEVHWDGGVPPAGLAGLRVDGAEVYRVSERILFDRSTASPSGWRRFGTHTRRPELTRADFVHAWTTGHAALVRRHHPGVVRYAQDLVTVVWAGAPALDGVYEADFPTPESYREHLYDSPEGERIIEADNARFVDGGLTERFFCALPV